GNVTNDGLHSYQYDAENRVTSVDGGSTAQYKYDHQNRRITKIVGTAWTHYVWQGSQVIGEHDATTAYTTNPTYQVNSARVEYIYSGSRMVSSRDRASSGGPWTTKSYLSDRLSTRLVMDASGNVLGRQAHLPFGEDIGTSGTQQKHHFTSYERDSESGLDYAVNRGYSPGTGRFRQADPYRASGYMTDPQSWNRYSYARNNPINRVDPLGLDDEEPIVLKGWAYYDREWSYDQKYGNSVNGSRGDDIEIERPPDPTTGGGAITHDLCQRVLGSVQLIASRGQGSLPNVAQFHAAQSAAIASGADLSLLLATWWIENSFAENPRNNLAGPTYGPMQLTRDKASDPRFRGGFTESQILGNLNSQRFDGDINANLTVGGNFLTWLKGQVAGDLALAGAAYLGHNAVIGRTPDQLRGAYRERYNLYQNLLPHFQWFKDCTEEADRQLAG
ncbi:MAG: RHS repeat-associated core domain-containing protein, partial [Blastocatellia bacterium]